MANIQITQLPSAGAITGTEAVPIVQNGVTVQTTTGAISGAGALNYTFLTVGSQSSLPYARSITVGSGLATVDGGAGSTYAINLAGAPLSLVTSGTGIQVKTSTNTVAPVSLQFTGTGFNIANPDGTTGNPTFSYTGIMANLSTYSGTGLLTVNGTNIGSTSVYGVANQTVVTNANTAPTIGLANNPIVPGTASMTLPSGSTASRPAVATLGMIRFNTDLGAYEVYLVSGWAQLSASGGVTSFSAGSTGFTPNTPTNGAITLSGTLNASSGGTGATSLTGYVYGNGTGVMTASTTVPTTALSGTITNAQLAYSSITINGNTVSLGASTTVTASTTSTLTIGTGLSGSSFNGSSPVTIALANTAVSAGSYTNANITVNAQGQITAATSGSAGGVTSFQTSLNGLTPATSTTGAVTLAGTLGISSGGTGQTTASSAFNALSPITTTGDLIIGNGTNSATRLGIGTNGYVLTSNGTTAVWQASTGGVTSFSAGTTGFTPSTGTTGAITLAGTLATTNGGTGLTSFTSGGAVYATSSSALTTGTLPVTAGGTGVATLTGLAYGNGTSAFTAATAAQVVAVIGTTAVTNATNATNLALTAGSGATNYITYAAAATGNQPQYTSTGITINATNSTITGGINGGTF